MENNQNLPCEGLSQLFNCNDINENEGNWYDCLDCYGSDDDDGDEEHDGEILRDDVIENTDPLANFGAPVFQYVTDKPFEWHNPKGSLERNLEKSRAFAAHYGASKTTLNTLTENYREPFGSRDIEGEEETVEVIDVPRETLELMAEHGDETAAYILEMTDKLNGNDGTQKEVAPPNFPPPSQATIDIAFFMGRPDVTFGLTDYASGQGISGNYDMAFSIDANEDAPMPNELLEACMAVITKDLIIFSNSYTLKDRKYQVVDYKLTPKRIELFFGAFIPSINYVEGPEIKEIIPDLNIKPLENQKLEF